MDFSTHKLYHVHSFDSRQHLDSYLSDKTEMMFGEDFLEFPIENLTKTFKLGLIKGDILMDLSIGSLIHHLYAACEFFKHVIVLKVRDRCILELKRWVDTRTGAFDWCHAAQLHTNIEGKRWEAVKAFFKLIHWGYIALIFKPLIHNQAPHCLPKMWRYNAINQLEEKEGKVRSALQHVVKCDLERENMMEPIDLPPADCIISAWLLDAISKDQDDYIRYLRKFSKLLKPGGHLILIGDIGATYFVMGKHKFHILKYDEDFVRRALAGEGFTIDCCKVKERTCNSDLIDHKAVLFIAAHKKK